MRVKATNWRNAEVILDCEPVTCGDFLLNVELMWAVYAPPPNVPCWPFKGYNEHDCLQDIPTFTALAKILEDATKNPRRGEPIDLAKFGAHRIPKP